MNNIIQTDGEYRTKKKTPRSFAATLTQYLRYIIKSYRTTVINIVLRETRTLREPRKKSSNIHVKYCPISNTRAQTGINLNLVINCNYVTRGRISQLTYLYLAEKNRQRSRSRKCRHPEIRQQRRRISRRRDPQKDERTRHAGCC